MPPASTTRARARYLERTYGITSADYDNLLAYREGACWVCGKKPKKRRLHVEHDHRTGRVRGLVDWRCNLLLQHANDDPDILRSAARFLESTAAQVIITLAPRETDAQV